MPKGISKTGTRTLHAIQCKICFKVLSHTGMNGHLSKHNLTVGEYVNQYGEYRPNKIKNVEKDIQCRECGEQFRSQRELTFHLRLAHHMAGQDYALKHIFFGETPKCKCGCNQETLILPRPPWKRDYLSGHNPNGMTGRVHTEKTKKILSAHSISRYTAIKKFETGIETKFKCFLQQLGMPFQYQVQTSAGVCDFQLQDGTIIEIDGEYWHPLELENLNLQLLSSAISDRRKNLHLSPLIRLRGKDLDEIKTLQDIQLYNSREKYPTKVPSYFTVIVTKEYLRHTLSTNYQFLKTNAYLFLKFIRTFQPTFPVIATKENLEYVIEKIPSKVSTVYNLQTKTFNNHCSSLGTSYLKSHFISYWKSKYKNGRSPHEIWQDDKTMLSIIKYRVGLNETQEVFDFSLHQIVKGISAIRGTISFFKPVLAASIYQHFLQNSTSPTVLDPCAGFGGRLLGFKSMYPTGTYIGLEPNVETYEELLSLKLKCEFDDSVQILNVKFEDYRQYDRTYDLIFTSIPYFDLEQYSNPVHYDSFGQWKQNFIGEFLKYNNKVVLNLPTQFTSLFEDVKEIYYLKHNGGPTSDNSSKIEHIIVI